MPLRNHSLALAALLAAVAALPAGCAPDGSTGAADGGGRVGTAACLACHDDRAAYTRTAHHLSSRPATAAAIAGSFAPGAGVLRTSNPDLHFRMDSTDDGFFQTAVQGSGAEGRTMRGRFDVVVGSGRKGQTYLSWTADSALVQLPVSFWRGVGWVNSPGYRDGLPNFGRPVPPRCLECHASYIARTTGDLEGNVYDPGTAVLGVGCEACHGPGAVHARRERSWARHVLGPGIVNPAALPRRRQVEVCGLCHGGAGQSRAEPFSYVPGEPLTEHLQLPPSFRAPRVDVHGDQVALLRDSPCFQRSEMTCATCHDVHAPQRDASAFAARCLGCHQVESCGLFPERGTALAGRCVECHMPMLPSATILSTFAGDTLRPLIRTHRIGIHPGAASR